MFFDVSKLLARVADPAAWSVALLLAALALLLARRLALASSLAALAIAVIGAFSSPAFASALQRELAASAPNTYRPEARYDAVIVLGGDGSRLKAGLEVVRTGRGQYLLYAEAVAARDLERQRRQLAGWGLDPGRLVVEGRSRNTRENAVEAARVVEQRGWRSTLLVTSAHHAPRALACFRRAGLTPDVLPVEERAGVDEGWLPRRAALNQSRSVLHELIGHVVYRAVGYAE